MQDFLDELDVELLGKNLWEENPSKFSFSSETKNTNPQEEKISWVEGEELILDEKWQKTLSKWINGWVRTNVFSKFPETKFYLPTLREGYTRVIPIGWNNETWAKNMDMFQYGEEILLADCWLQFAEPDMLWASYSIPDVSFLIQYKDNIKGIIITHAHLDHFWSLKHILPALWMPTIFGTKLTIGMIKKQFEEAK